jgi:DNA polymerase
MVKGVGNPKADIMFVGQNPGKDEDEANQPFAGASEKWLNRIIKAIGHKREEVYITNLVKCLTPENRLPSDEEIENCIPYLFKEIIEVNPKIIIPLGAVSTTEILACDPGIRITGIKGMEARSSCDKITQIIFPLLHPASLCYNFSGNYKPFCDDVKNLVKLLIREQIVAPIAGDWETDFKF